jgi:hypothetical protein
MRPTLTNRHAQRLRAYFRKILSKIYIKLNFHWQNEQAICIQQHHIHIKCEWKKRKKNKNNKKGIKSQ